MDIAVFRIHFPEFANETVYPDSAIGFWSDFAEKILDSTRWGQFRAMGLELYTAHMLSINAGNQSGNPGQRVGVIASKSVGDISVSMDISAVTVQNGGHWNISNYGTRFKQIANLVGMGAVQLS